MISNGANAALSSIILVLIGFTVAVAVYARGLKRMEATIDRMELQAQETARDLRATAANLREAHDQRSDAAASLLRVERRQLKVATALAAAQERADSADPNSSGASADAAARKDPTED